MGRKKKGKGAGEERVQVRRIYSTRDRGVYRPTRADPERPGWFIPYRKWYIEWTDEKGVRHNEAASEDEDVAIEMIRRRRAEVDRRRAGLPVEEVASLRKPLTEVVELFCGDLVRKGSDPNGSHVKDSRALLNRVITECGWSILADVRPDRFNKFLTDRAVEGKAPRTQNRYLETLRNMVNWCVRQGWLVESPLRRIEPVRVGEKGRRKVRRAFTEAELETLCALARPGVATVYRVAALSGFRRIELRRLVREDCTPLGDYPRWHVDARRTKNGCPVRLPMVPECAAALREHWERLAPGERLFRGPTKETFKTHLERAGIRPLDERGKTADFHSFRMLFCTLLAKQFPIEVVSKLMRHSSLNLTMRVYLDLGLDREGEGAWQLPTLLGRGDLHNARAGG